MSSCRRAFTLIELLVVIAIIAILAAILFPVFAQARERARAAACLSNGKQIATGLYMYAQDYDETFVMTRTTSVLCNSGANSNPWSLNIQPYIKNMGVFKCPSDPTTGANALFPKRSYVVTAGPNTGISAANRCEYPGGAGGPNWGVHMAAIEKPASFVNCYERWENGSHVGLATSVHANLFPEDWCISSTGVQYPRKRRWFVNSPNWRLPHFERATLVFADGHAKALTYSHTHNGPDHFDCAGAAGARWSVFDRRTTPPF